MYAQWKNEPMVYKRTLLEVRLSQKLREAVIGQQ